MRASADGAFLSAFLYRVCPGAALEAFAIRSSLLDVSSYIGGSENPKTPTVHIVEDIVSATVVYCPCSIGLDLSMTTPGFVMHPVIHTAIAAVATTINVFFIFFFSFPLSRATLTRKSIIYEFKSNCDEVVHFVCFELPEPYQNLILPNLFRHRTSIRNHFFIYDIR